MNNLFSENERVAPAVVADTKNIAGGKAYSLSAMVALAKYATTGTLNDTYQASAGEQLDKALKLCEDVDPEMIAKIAVYSRQHGRMKDTPSLLTAYLARTNIELCKKIFSRVINNPKMMRNFVQILRSGTINGSKSLGTAPKKLVQNYLNSLTDEQLFRANVGNEPSLRDVLRMMHPAPASKEREALYAYIVGKEPKQHDKDYLLPLVREFEAFKKDHSLPVPNVPFQMLTALPLTEDNWKTIAVHATYDQVRQNLNTFARHNVFNDATIVRRIADKLSDVNEVYRARLLPYKLFTTFLHVDKNVPKEIKYALEPAVEAALENVPTIDGELFIALDTSGSMNQHITGNNGSATSVVRYIDVAALFASAILRKNKHAEIIPFDTAVNTTGVEINPHDSIMTNATKLAAIRGGGTDTSVALAHLNKRRAKGAGVIYISDNESWRSYAGGARSRCNGTGTGTGMMEEWAVFADRNPEAKLVNIDISPSDTSQTSKTNNVMLCGGFSDEVFSVVAGYFREGGEDYWMNTINEIKL